VIQLNHNNTEKIADKIQCPSYDSDQVKTGIVHIGVGGFHRAHQAYYIHQLMDKHKAMDWGICGVGLREADRKMYDILKLQDHLYTLIVQHPDGSVNCEVIGAIQDMLLAVDTPELVLDKMANPDTRIVSMTITEGGYNFHPQTGEFDFNNPAIKQEIESPDQPKTIFGFLTEALRRRRANGLKPFTILSCDNIQHNGDMAGKMLLAFAEKQDAELAVWIQANVDCPNTMVDRITPVTTAVDIDYLQNSYQYKDEWPVICEPFIQWVIEDKFSNDRPPLEKLGVQFVPNVSPYEKMKIRLLNAGHSVLGISGAVHGHPTINACMEDLVFAKFMREFMDKEVTPILDDIEGIDVEDYKNSLEVRFANPNLKDSVSRICAESSAKLPKFLIPTIQDNLDNGGSIDLATFILAAWCYYSDKQTDEKGQPLEIIDENKEKLHNVAKQTQDDPLSFLSLDEVFGELRNNERFVAKYEEMIQKIYQENGIRKLMSNMISF